MAFRTNTVMASNQDTDEFVYLSNSDDSDFEESFRTIRDDTSEIFDPSPSSSLGSEMESVEEIKPTQIQMNLIRMVYKKLQIIIIPVMPKLNRISMMVGTGLICQMKRILDLNMGHF